VIRAIWFPHDLRGIGWSASLRGWIAGKARYFPNAWARAP